jgi:hypothetical protein
MEQMGWADFFQSRLPTRVSTLQSRQRPSSTVPAEAGDRMSMGGCTHREPSLEKGLLG